MNQFLIRERVRFRNKMYILFWKLIEDEPMHNWSRSILKMNQYTIGEEVRFRNKMYILFWKLIEDEPMLN